MAVSVEVSWGELVDKLTILEIKLARISDVAQRANVARERERLLAARNRALSDTVDRVALDRLAAALLAVNETLWQVEEDVRACEAAGDFGPRFVELARAVYRNNDRRADLKREISLLLGSELIEEKSYGRSGRNADPVAKGG